MSTRAKKLLIAVLLMLFYFVYLSVGVSTCGYGGCRLFPFGQVSLDIVVALWRWTMFIGVGLVFWFAIALFDREEEE